MNNIKIKVKKLNSDAILPKYAHQGDAGMDLFSCEEAIIFPKQRKLIHTGISMELPEGFVALIWDKSGLAANHGLKTMGGVIEHTYRGEYCVILHNTTEKEIKLQKGNKIAQILIQPIFTAELQEVQELGETKRGTEGFGSTGN